MDVEQLREDVRAGRIPAEQLLELVVSLSGLLGQSQQRVRDLEQRIDELEQKLRASGGKLDEPFSVRSEERRQEARGKRRRARVRSKRRGRISTAEKVAASVRTEKVFPAGVPEERCKLSTTRVVWRLEQGQAVLVAYELYRSGKQIGKIPGVLGQSEFGIEIVLAIAYQVYVVGLSFDKVCLLFKFFQNLELHKSQADSLLNQLSRHWESEFDRLCELLAHSAVVYTDETSWSLNSVWAFLSEQARVLFFGVHKDADTLAKILDPATFAGIVVSDDAAIYANFTESQKCWAHLLRKAIKLTLLEPANTEYRNFADRLLEIYRTACRVQRDKRFNQAGRAKKVSELDDQILELCGPVWAAELPPTEGPADDYRRLCNELMRLMLDEQLFTFVTAEAVQTPSGETMPVGGTNNESERTLRNPAQARVTGRTSKTLRGARRRTIVVSVLESLRQYLATFTLQTVIQEVGQWCRDGISCFAKQLEALKLPPPSTSILDRVFPQPAN